MELFKRFKKDKKFRNSVIVVGVILLFLFNTGGPQTQAVSQATCNQFNHIGDLNECVDAGCAADVPNLPSLFGLPLELHECLLKWSEIAFTCSSTAPSSEFLADSRSAATSLCGDGKKALESETYCYEKTYVCIDVPEGEECSGWQKPFAGFLDSVWKTNEVDSCSAKAYIVIGAVGTILLAVI